MKIIKIKLNKTHDYQVTLSKPKRHCLISIWDLILKILKLLWKLIWKLIIFLIRWLLWNIIKDELTPDHV